MLWVRSWPAPEKALSPIQAKALLLPPATASIAVRSILSIPRAKLWMTSGAAGVLSETLA